MGSWIYALDPSSEFSANSLLPFIDQQNLVGQFVYSNVGLVDPPIKTCRFYNSRTVWSEDRSRALVPPVMVEHCQMHYTRSRLTSHPYILTAMPQTEPRLPVACVYRSLKIICYYHNMKFIKCSCYMKLFLFPSYSPYVLWDLSQPIL